MPSPLSFNSTEDIRKKLLVKNLPPFNSDGFSPTTNPGQSELKLTNFSVVDSAEVEDIGDKEEVRLYLNNIYGPPGGYDDRYTVEDVQTIVTNRDTYYKFVSSTYNSADILLKKDPQGDNGSLTQDSVMIQLAAKSLKDEFQYRVDEEIRQETLGRANFLNALKDPFIAADILTGRQELIEPDWTISSPTNVIAKGLDFISRITGVYVPFSWIPGDYFEGRRSYLNTGVNIVSNLLGFRDLLPEKKNGSDIFLNNTGRGQTSQLFKSLEYNRFRPDYKLNFITDPNFFAPGPNYYIGSRTQDINDIVGPNNELPVDEFGKRIPTAVRGYGEIGNLYEGEQKFSFGLNTVEPGDSPDIQGGFTWVSPKSSSAAGKTVGPGGNVEGSDAGFPPISSQFSKSSSQRYSLTKGSILDDTQRLVDSADGLQGQARLGHVGTAINQVSKVFYDGTREITKGSRVRRYVNENGAEVGKEYCRVFTKDSPYYTMADLQKSEGNIRKFKNSVLDSTYNLNIAPVEGSNILDGQATKYMLSLENLAWRTSNMTQDLPNCEKGPNGGRVMWFPPYDLRVDENVTANWITNDFLGRPEPIYTYSNTQRQGSLSFKIIVDHPSVLNTLVDKELKNVTPDSEVTKIVDSFFSGCKTLDIYELARKYGQLSFNDIYEVVTKTNDPEIFREYEREIPKENPEPDNTTDDTPQKPQLGQFEGVSLYFDNDKPDSNSTSTTSSVNYNTSYSAYIGQKSNYLTQADSIGEKSQVETFFDTEIEPNKGKLDDLINQLVDAATNKFGVTIELIGSASSPNSKEYNVNLSKRRVDSVKKQILEDPRIKKVNEKGYIGITTSALGESTSINGVDCSQNITDETAKIYSVGAMGCRRTVIKSINVTVPPTPEGEQTQTDTETVKENSVNSENVKVIERGTGSPRRNDEVRLREGITKKVLRRLLTECDYFQSITDDTSFLYEGIKEKIKYFNPTFHSMTPEGLNSRLTFLQQCMRPGETIPTIGPDGKPLENNALNTSFGSPPICVLRVGDFFHTKIAINQMSVRYEPLVLDLNPEGIGVQPMMADVSLSFYFIGGHGLKEPVARLQNALSFNYYANTEMYDERSVATEDTSEIDRETIEALGSDVAFSIDDISGEDNRDGGTTIGEVTSKVIENSGQTVTGTIKYQKNMDDLVTNTKEYGDALIKTLEDVNEEFGQAGLFMFTKDRKYIKGSMKTTANQTDLYGKSENLQTKIDGLFTDIQSDINNENCPLLIDDTGTEFSDITSFKKSEVRKYKRKVKELLSSYKSNFGLRMSDLQRDLVDVEQRLIFNIDRLNYVYSLNDGFIQPSGQVVIYSISATTNVYDTNGSATDTHEELENDMDIISANLNGTLLDLENRNLISDDYSDSWDFSMEQTLFANSAQKRLYTVIQKDVLSENKIKTELLKWVDTQSFKSPQIWKDTINEIFDDLEVIYLGQQTAMTFKFSTYRDGAIIGNTYEPYTLGKIREFNFSESPTQSQAQVDGLRNLYSGVNSTGDKWNNKVKLQ
jgi:hypothetical protein